MDIAAKGKGPVFTDPNPDNARAFFRNKNRKMVRKLMSLKAAVSQFVQDGDYLVKKTFQRRCDNSGYGGGDKICAYRPTYFSWLFFIGHGIGQGGFFLPPLASTVSHCSTIETNKSHERLRVKNDGAYMPKKSKPCDNTHHVNENNRRKWHLAISLFRFGINPNKQVFDAEMFKEIKEFIKKAGFAKSIDFGNIVAIGKVLSDTGLIPEGGVPG